MKRPLGAAAASDSAPQPAPAPELISTARSHLAGRFARGVEAVLWEGRSLPLPDIEAVRLVTQAAAEGAEISKQDVAAALIATRSARLDLDRFEADLLDAALKNGLKWGHLAHVLGLPDGDTACRYYDRLVSRRELPVAGVERTDKDSAAKRL